MLCFMFEEKYNFLLLFSLLDIWYYEPTFFPLFLSTSSSVFQFKTTPVWTVSIGLQQNGTVSVTVFVFLDIGTLYTVYNVMIILLHSNLWSPV